MKIKTWCNYPKIDGEKYFADSYRSLKELIKEDKKYITHANGRSYGDCSLFQNVLSTISLNKFISFDEKEGILHLEAGVLLSDILYTFVSKGWFLSVTPGTKFITIGGAIASDVHGKNHHINGSFSNFVEEFNLLLANGEIITCSKNMNEELFKATCGGMGLTGVILNAKIKLININSKNIDQVTIKTKNLEETFKAFEEYKNYTYSVAWIDCFAKDEKLGRSLLMVGEHSNDGDLDYKQKKFKTVPFYFPSFILNNFSVRCFNFLYYNRIFKEKVKSKVDIDTFFYPLDFINNWNKIYGKAGFLQYQFVLPLENSYEGLKEILKKISESGRGSFLSILKLFGEGNENYLSFAKEGYTLALDFKVDSGIFEFLDSLDEIVLKHNGKFYLTKDARMKKEVFQAGYNKIDEFKKIIKQYNSDKKFISLQSNRLGI